MSGGLTIVHHYVIRWLLARSQRFPWPAQAFLDDAASRVLVQHVGVVSFYESPAAGLFR